MSIPLQALLRKTSQLLVSSLLAAGIAFSLPAAADVAPPIPVDLFPLTHPVGQQRLKESSYSQAYWGLANYFETQRNQAFCSVASSVIALNALGVPRPVNSQYPDFVFFTQDSFFSKIDPALADPKAVSVEGMTMEQLVKVLAAFPIKVTSRSGSDMSIDDFRNAMKDNLRYSDRVVLLNFDRKSLNEVGGGHWSPLAAYHPASDSVLVMDVARYKYPPLWVSVRELFAGSQTVDTVSGKSRGIVVISKP
ncbi:MAG: phytochelatin synthase family protein [Polaromonas sp.]